VRAEKRAQFEGRRSNTRFHVAAATAALVIVTAVTVFAVAGRGGDEGVPVAPTEARAGGDVVIPVADVSDGQAYFFSYDAGGVEVKYFVLQSEDGVVRAAFDACDVCYAQKKGYRQEGYAMVCNNCGQSFVSDQINEVRGGCNPSPLERRVEGDRLIIAADDIAAGARYFQ
jgi:uncharacterized membrane protein